MIDPAIAAIWPNICKQAIVPNVETIGGKIWFAIGWLWPKYWVGIFAVIGIWTIFEIATRHGNLHRNSDNGFSKSFNCFVGSSTYLLLQLILSKILEAIFSAVIYCNPISYILHYLVFFLTGGLLFCTYFWAYWKIPFYGKIWH